MANPKSRLLALGMAGSPRRKGNSTALLSAYLEGAASEGLKTRSIYLNGLTYKGCQACDRCVKGKPCRIEDDLVKVFPLVRQARIWAMASPIYYDGVSGQLKTFFDRLRFFSRDPFKLEGVRRGIVIVTYEDKPRKDYLRTAEVLADYFSWNQRGDFGKVEVVAAAELGPKDAWKGRPELLEKLRKTGARQARELKALV